MENKNLILGVLLIGLVIFGVVQAFQISSIKKGISGVTGSATKQIDTSGWSENERMNYEMHGTVPAKYQGSQGSAAQQPQMVGGC